MTAPRIAAAVAAVALLCLSVWRFRTGRPRRGALALAAALALSLFAGGGAAALPDSEDAVADAGNALGAWTYAFAAGMAFLETPIPPLTVVFPGEWAVLMSGAIAGEGEVRIVPLVGLVWAASAAGDSVTFALGRRLGRPFLERRGPAFGLSHSRLERVDTWCDRFGGPGVCLGRLLPLARPFGPFIAGASRLRYARFLPWSLAGTLLFSLLFCLLGYAFYRSYDDLVGSVGLVAAGALAVAIVAAILVIRRRRRRASA